MASLINNRLPIIRTGNAVILPVDCELMQVAIEPAERGLNDSMQLVECKSARHKNAAPDGRAHFVQSYLELIDGGDSFGGSS